MADYTEIIQEINTNLPDNNTQSITAAKLRTTLIDFVGEVSTNETTIENQITPIVAELDNIKNQLITETSLSFTYDGSNIVKSNGLETSTSVNFGCFISDVSEYIGKNIKVLGFETLNTEVGLGFFTSDNNIMSGTYLTFKISSGTSGPKEYTLTVPENAKYVIVTSYVDFNRDDYYCKVSENYLDSLQDQIDVNSNDIEDLKNELTTETNLSFTDDQNHVVKSTGLDTTTSANYGCFISDVSDYIGKQIKVLGFKALSTTAGLAFFDESNTMISGSFVPFQLTGTTSSSQEYTVTVPQNAKYLICTYYSSYNYSNYYCKVIQSLTEYLEREVNENNEKINSLEINFKDEQQLSFIYDGNHTVKSTGLDTTTSDNYGCFISDVSDYIGYAVKFLGFEQSSGTVGFAFFTEDYNIIEGSYVSYSQYGTGTNVAEFGNVVPENAKYFIAAAHNSYNKTNYYCNVILRPVYLDSYNNYHTKNYRVNFTSYDELIAAYDALVTAYPHYVYKSELSASGVTNGITSDGIHKLYEYRFALPNYNDTQLTNNNRSRDSQISKPKILIAAGVHGSEISAITSVYLLAKDLCEGNMSLAELKAGFDIRILPSVNPYGIDHDRRGNANGVDINRNFPAEGQDWTPSTSRSSGYDYTVNSGYLDVYDESTSMEGYHPGTAGDQPETKLIMAWALANDDAVVFFDTHNSLYANEYGYLGSLTHTGDELKRNAFHSVDKAISYLINYRKLRYPYKIEGVTLVTSVFMYSGGGNISQLQGQAGTMGQFRIANNFAGGTVEFCNVINTQSIKIARYSMMIGVIGCEIFGNILMSIVENYNVNEPKTICETSELKDFGLWNTKLVWDKTLGVPKVWNGTEWITLAISE